MVESYFEKKDPSIEGSKYPIEGLEEILKPGFEKIEPTKITQEKDTLEMSQEFPPVVEKVESDKPRISIPDPEKISDPNIKKAAELLKTQRWLAPSFIAAFTAVMFELLQLQKEVRYKEADIELLVRQELFELAKSNAHLAKLITDSQAWEKLVQAVSSFVSAAVTTVNMIETTKNIGKASTEIADEIKNKKTQLAEAMKTENPQGVSVANNIQDIDDIVRNSSGYKYTSKQVTDLQDTLKQLESNREYNISNKERMYSQISSMRGEALKATIQGVTQVLTASITFDRGRMEEMKGLNEGMMQSFNKFSETSAKARDDAKAMYDRFADFLARIIDSVFKAHKLGQAN